MFNQQQHRITVGNMLDVMRGRADAWPEPEPAEDDYQAEFSLSLYERVLRSPDTRGLLRRRRFVVQDVLTVPRHFLEEVFHGPASRREPPPRFPGASDVYVGEAWTIEEVEADS